MTATELDSWTIQSIIDGGRTLVKVDFEDDSYECDWVVADDATSANCWSSFAKVQGEQDEWGEPKWHLPCFDVDVPFDTASLHLVNNEFGAFIAPNWIPSTTEGHHHVYIDHPYEFTDYCNRLQRLVDLGIVEEGYLRSTERRGSTMVRLPHVRKESTAVTVAVNNVTTDLNLDPF